MEADQNAGGFVISSLPSPAPSNLSTISVSNLPHPRSHPLRPGSAKEDAVRRYVEVKLLHISRRYTKKFQSVEDGRSDDVKGYVSFAEAARDTGEVIDVLWLSGTPSLQIPYFLNIAGTVNTYLPAFPAAPRSTFALLRKLDHAFSSLLKGEDSVTGEVLPGFEGGLKRGLTGTDMVRVKNLVMDCRVIVVDMMNGERDEDGSVDESGVDESDVEVADEGVEDELAEEHQMDVARVYEGTIFQLGEVLKGDGVAIGIPQFPQTEHAMSRE